MTTTLKDLEGQYVTKLKELRGIAAKAESEDRDFTAEERTEIVSRTDELNGLKAQVKELKGDADLRNQIKNLSDDIGLAPGDAGGSHDGPTGSPGRGKSIGEQFVNSAEFKGFMDQFPQGQIPAKAKGLNSPPVGFKDILTGGSDTSAGAFVQTDYTGIYEPLGRRPLVLRDIISTRQTGSDTVEYVRQTTRVDAAASVPEASGSSAGDESGDVVGTKPEGSMALEKVTESVSTIAVWIPATKRALSDASQLRGLIDDELMADLDEEVEDQIVSGDGSGDDFVGLANTPNVQSQAYDTSLLVTTRKARTKVKTVGRSMATAYLMHPNDWEALDLLQQQNGQFYFGGPRQLGVPTLWGLPVVESEACSEGVGYVGDFRKAIMWDREQATIQVSDSHSDFFIRNLVAVLAELRAAFGVIRPTAFVEIDLDAAT